MSLNGELLTHIAKLAAIELGQDESDELRQDLSQIIGYINRIQGHETDELFPNEEAVYRRPDIAKSHVAEKLFATAPSMKNGLFSTPVVTQSLAEKARRRDHSK